MSIVFVALSLLAWIMSRHSECCVCFRYICTYDSYKETVIKVLQSRSDYVPKLSIAILILSIGPVLGDRLVTDGDGIVVPGVSCM